MNSRSLFLVPALLSLVLCAAISSSYAADDACGSATVSDTQKKQIQDAFYDNQKESIPIEAELKLAKLDEKKLLSTAEATFDDAQTASAKTAEVKSRLDAVITKLKNTILYTIVEAKDRELASKCFERGRHPQKRNSRGARRGKGAQPDQGQNQGLPDSSGDDSADQAT